MTKNQIEYQKLVELKRANLANERLTADRDAATRRLGLDTLQETARHNQQVELQARDNLAEQYRNNTAQLQEIQRSHLASEGLTQQTVDNEYRKNVETGRHNLATELLTDYATAVSKLGAELGASSRVDAAGISAAASQYASDNALLAKQLDIDLGKLNIASNVGLKTAQLSEEKRKAIAAQSEINRTNRTNEQLKASGLLETLRHNYVGERQGQQKISTDVSLRQEQNKIAAGQADTQRRLADANISLIPSQKFVNYSKGIQGLSSALSGITNIVKKGR